MADLTFCPDCGTLMGELEPTKHVCGGLVCRGCGHVEESPFVCLCSAGVAAPGHAHAPNCPLWEGSSCDCDTCQNGRSLDDEGYDYDHDPNDGYEPEWGTPGGEG